MSEEQSAAPPPPPAGPPPGAPLVAWEAPAASPVGTAAGAGGYASQPAFGVVALLADTFARYGADFLRLILVAAATSALSWLGSFAAPVGSNPFGRPTGFVDVGGLLGLASFVVGIVASSTTFALAEGGRAVPFGRALRRGIERAGWLFLTSLLLGVAFIAVILLALIPIGLFYFLSPALVLVPVLIVFAIIVWFGVRLTLALPANVADNLNSIEAVRLSWRVTKASGIWLRLIGAALLLGLLVLPAGIGALLLAFPAMFSGGAAIAFVVPAIAFSVFTPLSALLSFSAYRRLVPPIQPSWTATAPAPPIPVAPPPPGAPPDAAAPAPSGVPMPGTEPPPSLLAPAEGHTAAEPPPAAAPSIAAPFDAPAAADDMAAATPPPAPAFRMPPFGTAAKAILALILALDVAGLFTIPFGVVALERFAREGFPGFPGAPGSPSFPGFPGQNGEVLPGRVAFGTGADLDTCSLDVPVLVATSSTEVQWIATLERTVTPGDEVFLRITKDGQELETTLQDPGTYDCLGTETGLRGLAEGIYTYDVVVNGVVSATGALFVQ